MEQFKSYLIASKTADEKRASFYLSWVDRFYKSCNKILSDSVTEAEKESFLKDLSKSREDWQVKQASAAINLYLYFKERRAKTQLKENPEINSQWKTVAEEMPKVLRLMHRSYRTEQTYIGWVRQFYGFAKGSSP